jgi:hypothetical protein
VTDEPPEEMLDPLASRAQGDLLLKRRLREELNALAVDDAAWTPQQIDATRERVREIIRSLTP